MFVFLLRFDWCDVAERFEQAFPIEPIDPLQGFPFGLILGFPRPQSIDDFDFEQADDRFGQGVVTTVTVTTDGRLQPGSCQSLSVLDRDILAAAIRVADQVFCRFARVRCGYLWDISGYGYSFSLRAS